MGTAAREMVYFETKITKYVSDNGSASCQIWFLQKGHLIKSRYEKLTTAGCLEIRTCEESLRRENAEKESVEAAYKNKRVGKLHCEEMQLKKDANIRDFLDWKEMFSSSSSQTSSVTSFSAAYTPSAPPVFDFLHGVELLQKYKKERDELKVERDGALRDAEELRHSAESGSLPQLLSEFSYSEIEDATHHFEPCLKIDEDGYWRIYRGVLCHTEVAIKLLDADGSKGPSEYRQEVEALSRLRHPNIVNLIGACPEALAIIYEHFPNGSLEDRLNCKDNSSPLPWKTRICIAAELCSVLIFLHSNKSHCIVHGDLKPSNILLDANFRVKLSHFGLSRAITTAESTPKSDIKMLCKLLKRLVIQRAADGGSSQSSSIKKPSDTFVYMDIESVITGEYSPKLDVYPFGIILLRLLTGKEAWDTTKEVQLALDNNGDLNSLLDCSAGHWPYLQAQQLAQIALRCSDLSRSNRPDLESEVLGVLQTMKASSGGNPGDTHHRAPPYYFCPINHEVMQDPHVAADGFTYEKEAIQKWLRCHTTSPMTNLKMDHMELVPNRSLRSAIQESEHHL